jgi:hypothetical protein
MKSVMVPLAVASDRSESVAFSEQRLVNMFPEKAQFGGKSPFVLLWAPALKPLGPGVGTGPWRGGIVMDGVLYIVSGGTMYSVNGAGIGISLGAIDGSGYVSMATVGTQICVATSAGHGFHYDSLTGTLQQITDVDFFGGTSVCSLDGYFIWSSGGATPTRFQWSALLNGLLYDALDFASAESTATELIRAYLVGSQIFMMKPDRIEIWFDGGLQDSPFERMSSTIIPKGVAAKFSPALLDNTVFWLGQDDEAGGGPVVYRANGYVPEVISTPAVARALADIGDLDSIRGVSYIKDNHAFYGILLPSGNSWWFDVSMGEWHERETYGHLRWLGNGLTAAYGKTIVGSHLDGALYQFDKRTFYDADTIPMVADITLPTFGTDPDLKRCSRLRLDMEAGVGITTGQGSDPIVTLTFSDDRGHTFSSDLPSPIGKIGQYDYGVQWFQLGQFRSRVHRFRITDPVKRAIIACYADIV